MLTHYFTMTIAVLKRRPFYTAISLFGISFTLLVLMVMSAMADHMLAPMAPESRQARMLGVHSATMFGPNNTWNSDAGYLLFDRYAKNLPGVEELTLFTSFQTVTTYLGDQRISSNLKRTDAAFWRVFDFTFLEGGPYGKADVDEARFVAVISRESRQRLFGGAAALGKSFEADGQSFRVVGVVENVSDMRFVPYGDVFAPLTTAKSNAYKQQIMGGFHAVALARTTSDLPIIREEFNSRIAKAELPDKGYTAIVAPFETHYDSIAREGPWADRRSPDRQGSKLTLLVAVLAVLFVTLPTVNLINVNISRILERASEIGVRKAFGAPTRTLVAQFVVENVILTLAGGAIGLVLSALVLRAINQSGFVAHSAFTVNVRVFTYGTLLAIAFGLISGVYPAWRMARLHPVEALKGGPSR
ncbi:MAG: ABC transporter permease [Vicinamibacteraceae bacterium]